MGEAKVFAAPHRVSLDCNGVEDRETLGLFRDALAVEAASYGGVVMGPWLETRLRELVAGWMPGWCISHAQVADEAVPEMQSRTWDLVIHRPVPSERGYPPAAAAGRDYPLVPKDLVCAVVDAKYTFAGIEEYANAQAVGLRGDAGVRQIELLAPIPAAVFAMRVSGDAVRAAEKAGRLGLNLFALATVLSGPRVPATAKEYRYRLCGAGEGILPLGRFRGFLQDAEKRWRGVEERG